MHRLLLIALLLTMPTFAQEVKKALPPRPAAKPKGLGLKDGDRFIFIGDSITHQCLYTQYVEDFFFTRYPTTKIAFRNAGISGDRAADALDRFDDDIAAFKPTIATVLLGMNDASYKDFDPAIFKTYAEGMTKLCDKLDAIGCRVILMSPTMFDHQAFDAMVAKDPAKAKNKQPDNYNGVLAYYGKWVQETARKRGYGFVDLYGPLNDHTNLQRQTQKDFTLIADAIHPAADGQLVMAYEILRQTGELGGVYGSGVRVSGDKWAPLSPALVTDVSGYLRKTASYTALQKSLPWVVPTDAALGWKLTNAGHRGTQESHVVVGLEAGRYDLFLNGKEVGTFDEKMLSVHAEIENDPDSPTHQQALQVAELNKKRNDETIRPLRDLYSKRKGELRKAKAAGGNMEAFNTWVTNELKPKEAELLKKAAEYEAQIDQLNDLAPVKVEVRPTTHPLPNVGKAKGKAKAAAKKAA